MRYRLLKELPKEAALDIICRSIYMCNRVLIYWAKDIGDRDLLRQHIYSWEVDWARDIGDIGYMREKTIDRGNTPYNYFGKWNYLYQGTKYEIPTV